MRLLRIRLKNWRGVEAAELELDAGITIVEGDNEAGKSSFIEALNLLFRERDSTKKQELKRVTPKGVDAGSTVEVEFTTGAYHLTYCKTFNKKTSTTLQVHAPAVEQLVGVDAHTRVLEILDDSIDVSLWQAIQLEQGGEFNDINFGHSRSLAKALDNIAGGTGAGEGEAALLQKVRHEYLKYFTEHTKKEKGELAQLRVQKKQLAESDESLFQALSAIDSEVEAKAAIDQQLVDIQQRLPEFRLTLSNHEKQQAQNAVAQHKLTTCLANVETLTLKLKELEHSSVARKDLSKKISDLEAASLQQQKELVALEQAYKDDNKQLAQATENRDKLIADRKSIDQKLRQVETAVQLREKNALHSRLQQQYKVASEIELQVQEVTAALAQISVDDKALDKLQVLDRKLREKKMRVEAWASQVSLHFLKSANVDVEGCSRKFEAGESLVVDSSKSAEFTVENNLRIEIDPAVDTRELTSDLQRAEVKLNDFLADHNVVSMSEAVSANKRRAELQTTLKELRRSASRVNKGASDGNEDRVSADTILSAIQSVGVAIDALQKKNSLANHEAIDLDQQQVSLVHQVLDNENRLATARDERDRLQKQFAGTETKLELARQEKASHAELVTGNKTLLAQQVDALSAVDLDKSIKDLQQQLAQAKAASDQARVDTGQAAQTDVLVDNARMAMQRAEKEVHDLQIRQTGLAVKLDQSQAEGLHEKHQSVLADREDLTSRLKQLDRRANAAAYLWESLSKHQRQAHLSYAKPLADKVASMGRVVFGEDFSIELSESLTVVSRTLKGITVPFDDLSGGVREQLGILLRLAAAQLVQSGISSFANCCNDMLSGTIQLCRRCESVTPARFK